MGNSSQSGELENLTKGVPTTPVPHWRQTKRQRTQVLNQDQSDCTSFLAALAALGLPWSLTYSTAIVLDSKPSSLPDQTPNLANLMGVIRKQKDNDKDKENDNENDKYIYRTPSKSDL